MPRPGPGRRASGAALAVLVAYAFALQLLLSGLAGALAVGRAPEPGLGPHVLCLSGPAEEAGSAPATAHDHGFCCTLACGAAALLAPVAYLAVVYEPAEPAPRPPVEPASRPSTDPPDLGRAPRPPPSDLA